MMFELNDPLFLPHCSCHVHFALQEGQILVLTGENGIGKSTLLSRLSRFLPQASCCLVEQKTLDAFFDRNLQQLKNFFLKSSLTSFDPDTFLTLWRELRLEPLEQRFISQLSGGEAQSLKLCLGLSRKASWYLLDEPSQFLDDSRKIILREQLQEVAKRGAGLIIVEHDQSWLHSSWTLLPLKVEGSQLMGGP